MERALSRRRLLASLGTAASVGAVATGTGGALDGAGDDRALAAQLAFGWERTYDDAEQDGLNAVVRLAGGGYAAAGISHPSGGTARPWLVTFDDTGALRWSRTYTVDGDAEIWDVDTVSGDGYLLVGSLTPGDGSSAVGLLVRVDESGDERWRRTVPADSGSRLFRGGVETSDGAFAVAGYTNAGGGVDGWVGRFGAGGDTEWTRSLTLGAATLPLSVFETVGDDLLVTGTTQPSDGSGNLEGLALSLSASGDTQWSQSYVYTSADGTNGYNVLYDVAETTSGYLAVGFSAPTTAADAPHGWAVATDDAGAPGPNTAVSAGDGTDSLLVAVDRVAGEYALVGQHRNADATNDWSAWITGVDGSLARQWTVQRQVGDSSPLNDGVAASDGGLVAVGRTTDDGGTTTDGLAMSFDQSESTPPPTPTETATLTPTASPTPTETASPTPTDTATATPTDTATATPTDTATATPSATAVPPTTTGSGGGGDESGLPLALIGGAAAVGALALGGGAWYLLSDDDGPPGGAGGSSTGPGSSDAPAAGTGGSPSDSGPPVGGTEPAGASPDSAVAASGTSDPMSGSETPPDPGPGESPPGGGPADAQGDPPMDDGAVGGAAAGGAAGPAEGADAPGEPAPEDATDEPAPGGAPGEPGDAPPEAESSAAPGESAGGTPAGEGPSGAPAGESAGDAQPEGAAVGALALGPAADRFGEDCEAVRTATGIADWGPVHVYAAASLDGRPQHVMAVAPAYADDEETTEAFKARGRIWADLSGEPGVAEVYEAGTEPWPWVAFAPGDRSLAEAADALNWDARVRILGDIATGLRSAEAADAVHGTLSLETVKIDGADGRLVDWGASRAAEVTSGETYVTVYTAPEQIESPRSLDPATDVYRFGAVAYRLLVGQDPLPPTGDVETHILEGNIVPPGEVSDLRPAVADVLTRALARDPVDRYETPAAFHDALQDALGGPVDGDGAAAETPPDATGGEQANTGGSGDGANEAASPDGAAGGAPPESPAVGDAGVGAAGSAAGDAGTGAAGGGAALTAAAEEFAADCELVRDAAGAVDHGAVQVYDVTTDDGADRQVLTIAPEYAADESAREAFRSPAQSWSGISENPHIATVFEVGSDPRPWVLFDGRGAPFSEAVRSMDRPERVGVVSDLADGLRTAALYNVTHGTVAPETVRIGDRDAALTDWGVSLAVGTAVDDRPVTPYTAPEQVDPDGVTSGATDVYRLAAVAYRLFTDRDPIEATDDLESAIRDGRITAPTAVADVPSVLDDVLLRAMSPDQGERHGSAYAFKNDIERYL